MFVLHAANVFLADMEMLTIFFKLNSFCLKCTTYYNIIHYICINIGGPMCNLTDKEDV